MPTNTTAKVGIGYEGLAVGVTSSVKLECALGPQAVVTSVTGTTRQVFDRWSVPITLGATGSTQLNLMSGMVNPLNESISGAGMAFATVLAVAFQNGATTGTGVVEAFGGTVGSQFQGPLGPTCKVALAPGQCFGANVPANMSGWTVNSTAKVIELRNLATTAATVNALILGTV